MDLGHIIENITKEKDLKLRTRPYFNHSVEMKRIFSPKERAEALEKVETFSTFRQR
jgi:hypothetical protein